MKVMQQHMDSWKELTKKKSAIIYEPVFAPKGIYGMAVIETNDEDQADRIATLLSSLKFVRAN